VEAASVLRELPAIALLISRAIIRFFLIFFLLLSNSCERDRFKQLVAQLNALCISRRLHRAMDQEEEQHPFGELPARIAHGAGTRR